MNVELNEISAVKQEITAKFEWDEVKDIYNNTVRELKQDFRMNGFRPGKVPTNLVKKQIGPKIKYQTLNRIFREYNDDVFEEAGVKMDELLDYSITDVEFEENKPFSYKIEIEMDPEVEVFDYKEGFSLKKKEYEVDDEDVDLYIDEMKEQQAQAKIVDEGAEMGHYVKCDLQKIDEDGVPIVGNKAKDQTIQLGEGPFTEPGISNLIGAQEGDEPQIFLETDDGKVHYKVNVKEVEEHILPEIDDEWVEENLETVDTVEDWKSQIKDMLKQNWDNHSKQEFEAKIKDYFIDQVDIKIPEARVEYYLEQLIKDAKNRSQQQEINEEAIKQNKRAEAEQNVKWHLISEKIKEEENIQATDEEIEKKLDEMVQQYPNENRDQIKNYYRNNDELKRNLELQIEEEKIMDHIKEFVEVDKEVINTSDARNNAHHHHHH
ncbi:MAG TPA: trigger factor [bacterium]|nr:trigger factor [bacterium]